MLKVNCRFLKSKCLNLNWLVLEGMFPTLLKIQKTNIWDTKIALQACTNYEHVSIKHFIYLLKKIVKICAEHTRCILNMSNHREST